MALLLLLLLPTESFSSPELTGDVCRWYLAVADGAEAAVEAEAETVEVAALLRCSLDRLMASLRSPCPSYRDDDEAAAAAGLLRLLPPA